MLLLGDSRDFRGSKAAKDISKSSFHHRQLVFLLLNTKLQSRKTVVDIWDTGSRHAVICRWIQTQRQWPAYPLWWDEGLFDLFFYDNVSLMISSAAASYFQNANYLMRDRSNLPDLILDSMQKIQTLLLFPMFADKKENRPSDAPCVCPAPSTHARTHTQSNWIQLTSTAAGRKIHICLQTCEGPICIP